MHADLVLKSDAVFTGTGMTPFRGGVALAGSKIVACGDDRHLAPFIGGGTEVRAYGDQLIMPGFIDSHTHFAQGALAFDPDFCVNLLDCTSFEQVMERMQAFAAAHPNNDWLVGFQLVQLKWDVPKMPTAAMIDAYIPDRPVFLSQIDMHTFSANTCAMKLVGIARDTPDPTGGRILRDGYGEPTGVFSNNAGALLMNQAYNPAPERARESFARSAREAVARGITSIGVVNPTFVGIDDPYRLLADMSRAGEFPLRAFLYTDLFETERMTLDEIRAKYRFPGSSVAWNGFKQFIDGVCSDHTAWMLEDYRNAPGNAGCPAEDPERVRAALLKACAWGVPVRIHTIGDAAVRNVLDWFEEAERRYGKQGLRHCMEHNETVQPEDVPRFAQLGVVASMQPWHILLDIADMAKNDAVGLERAALSWPIRSLLAAGATMSFGSDFPVVGLDPMEGLYGAVHRMLERDCGCDDPESCAWFPGERITMAEALRAYTYGSAYAMGIEDRVGTLAPGKEADICVLSRNLFDCTPGELLDTASVLTVSGGKIVYGA